VTAPEKISEADLEKVLEAMAESVESDSSDFLQLGDLAGKELLRRFKEDPTSLPSTFMFKFFLDFQKALAAKQLPTDPEKVQTSVLEIVNDSTLPDERKKELLFVERERLEDELELVRAKLEEM
jgi:hypothetical protein